ncbi:MAG: competence/damage-inducible protein A [Alphaproteobacteria bacterium]|nr:competence/damage-inducible protein A [Alphaproteobacteria bacterium]
MSQPLKDPQRIYTAALVIIGNEILSGRTQDANTNYIAKGLVERGIRLSEVRVVPDIEDRIIEAVNALRNAVDYVFTTGGIGPTHDDITAQSIANAFGIPLILHEEAYRVLLDHYGSEEAVTPARAKMAMTPEGAQLISNPVSGAPGFVIGNVYIMAGVPRIMQAMFDAALETLEGGAIILSRTVECPFPESAIAEQLTALQGEYPDIDMGSYPVYQNGEHSTSLVLRGTDEPRLSEAERVLTEIVKGL